MNHDANFNSNSSNSSSNSTNSAIARNSTTKKKQSFQELITESLFTNRRGSPNTISIREAEEQRRSHPFSIPAPQRILSFKEKKKRMSLSL